MHRPDKRRRVAGGAAHALLIADGSFRSGPPWPVDPSAACSCPGASGYRGWKRLRFRSACRPDPPARHTRHHSCPTAPWTPARPGEWSCPRITVNPARQLLAPGRRAVQAGKDIQLRSRNQDRSRLESSRHFRQVLDCVFLHDRHPLRLNNMRGPPRAPAKQDILISPLAPGAPHVFGGIVVDGGVRPESRLASFCRETRNPGPKGRQKIAPGVSPG